MWRAEKEREKEKEKENVGWVGFALVLVDENIVTCTHLMNASI